MATKQLEAVETPLSGKKTTLGSIIKLINVNLKDEFIKRINTGTYLDVVESDKLYKEDNHGSFREFVEKEYEGFFDYAQAKTRIKLSRLFNAILADKPPESEIPAPTSDSQLKPLVAYTDLKQASKIYWDAAGLKVRSGGRVTGNFIDDFRRGAIDIPSEAPVSNRSGNGNGDESNEEPSDIDFSDTTKTVNRTAAQLSTLDRIQALAEEGTIPANSREAIETDVIRVPNNHLSEWNERDPERFKMIARLVFGAALTYEKAKNLLNQFLTPDNNIQIGGPGNPGENLRLVDFVYLAIAKGGKGSVSFRGYTITADPKVEA